MYSVTSRARSKRAVPASTGSTTGSTRSARGRGEIGRKRLQREERPGKSGAWLTFLVGAQPFDEDVERQVAVIERAERRLFDLRDRKLGEARISGEAAAEDEVIDEAADDPTSSAGRSRFATGEPTTTSSWPE